jgi:hypothetical protein
MMNNRRSTSTLDTFAEPFRRRTRDAVRRRGSLNVPIGLEQTSHVAQDAGRSFLNERVIVADQFEQLLVFDRQVDVTMCASQR